MAHRTNVIQIPQNIPTNKNSSKVIDPICKMEIATKDAKCVLFRQTETIYFCSKECQLKYSSHKKQDVQVA